MGFKTFGFGFGREDIWEPEEINWGIEDSWLGDERYSGQGEMQGPFGADQMGLIYVNPEGPGGNPDPLEAAKDIRQTFARMAMNDEETVALIVGGHTFGKTHGAVGAEYVGPEPEGAPLEAQGLGWKNTYGTGNGADTMTSGLEGAWTSEPTKWDNGFLDNVFNYDWELAASPAGLHQWAPRNPEAQGTVLDAHDPSKRHAPIMLTTDLALKVDPIYAPIAKRFHEHPDELAASFAKAWYKLLHRDMGPVSRYPRTVGPRAAALAGPGAGGRPRADRSGRDRRPQGEGARIGPVDLRARRHGMGFGGQLPGHGQARWRQRGPDPPGAPEGLGGEQPGRTGRVWQTLEQVRQDFNRSQSGGIRVSLADLIVLGGCAAVERAARNGGLEITVPFAPGRTDATQEQTDVESFAVLEPTADGFRNYLRAGEKVSPEHLLVERAYLLTLTAPEMAALVGGMRVLDANFDRAPHGVLTDRPETLTNDFFVNLLDMGTSGRPRPRPVDVYEGRDRATGELRWTATAVDLVFGSNSQLRAVAEVYGSDDSKEKFVRDFVAAWDKVMSLDRFDLA